MDFEDRDERETQSPKKANPFSRIMFLFTLKLFWKTFKTKKLKNDDLYGVLSSQMAQNLGDELEHYWNLHVKRHKKPSIYRVIWSCYGHQYVFLGVVQLFMRTVVVVMIPKTLSNLIGYFEPNSELTKLQAYILTSTLIGLNVLNVTYLQNYLFSLSYLGIKVRTALVSLIYRRCLKDFPSKSTIGNVITLITKDVTAFETIIFYTNDVWIGFAQAGIVCYLIYRKMGPVAFIGMGFFVLMIPLQVLIGKLTSKYRLLSSKKTDERLHILQETLNDVRFVKINAWEDFFEKRIKTIRSKEANLLVKTFLSKIAILLMGALTSKLAFFFLTVAYAWSGGGVPAELTYYVLTLFQRIRHALNVTIPKGIAELSELRAAVCRIEALLNAEVSSSRPLQNSGNIFDSPYLTLKDVSVGFGERDVLKGITVEFQEGLTTITGPVGSGKSVLLKALLGNYELKGGSLMGNGILSYASQEPWIFPSTIRQNILFGQEYNEARYEMVLEVCSLSYDLANFKEGDNHLIADRGLNLSKGQKARLNLARAVYKNSDIYLIDDCLSSLDPHVQEYVFNMCMRTFLKNKICIFATSNLRFLERSDVVLSLENGNLRRLEKMALKVPQEKFDPKVEKETSEEYENEEDDEMSNLLVEQNLGKKKLYEEEKSSGKVKWDVYEKYISFGGGTFMFLVVLIFFFLTHFTRSWSDKTLSNWVNIEQDLSSLNRSTLNYSETVETRSTITTLYSVLTLSSVSLSVLTAYLFFNFSRRASNRLHDVVVHTIIMATMRFFDDNHLGNILNRFSKDFTIIDEQLPFVLFDFFEILFGLSGVIFLILLVKTTFILPIVILFAILHLMKRVYMPTGRNLQRLDVATRSPVVGYLYASLEGLTTIKALNAEKLLVHEFSKHQNLQTSANYLSICCSRAFALYLDLACTFFIAVIIVSFIYFDANTSVGDVGLAITQAFTLSGLVQYGIRLWAETENKMTSVERILDYTELEEETRHVGKTPLDWPTLGSVSFESVSMAFPNSEGYVLKNVSFTIPGGEKVGIVGRTGAGKSSIISALTRLYPFDGSIKIDGVDVSELNLDFHRRRLAVIPQEPVLFTGTVRENLDPFETSTDSDLWRALDELKLNSCFSFLDSALRPAELSVGQKQLLCLGRAVLSKCKVIVLDEANASVDEEAEKVFETTLREAFESRTVILIAHRLEAVLDCDRVMVIDAGRVVEFGSPQGLLRVEGSRFRQMVLEANILTENSI